MSTTRARWHRLSRVLSTDPPNGARSAPAWFAGIWLAGAWFGCVWFVVGCAAVDSADYAMVAGAAPPTPQCASASDCDGGMACHAELHICTATTGEKREVALIAKPLPDSTYAASHIPRVSLSVESPVVNFVLPKTVLLTGRVRVKGNALETSVEASLFAFASEKVIPGEDRTAQAEVKNDFALTLQAGLTYELAITAPAPDGDRPVYKTTIRYDSDTEETFWLPAMDSLPTMSGRVVERQGSLTVPLAGVRVTPVPKDPTTTCTAAVAGKLGEFTVRCSAPGRVALTVQPTDDGPVVPSFTARLEYGTSMVDEWQMPGGQSSLPDIVAPTLRHETEVAVRVRGAGSELLEGVEVALVASLEDGDTWRDATVRSAASTDRQGQAELRTVEGSYDLHVVPPAGEPWASVILSNWQVPADASRPVDLAARATLSGVVTAADGVPVGNARVVAETTSITPSSGATTSRQTIGETDDGGRYALAVDAGTYTLTVTPRSESGMPSYYHHAVLVTGADATHDVTLAQPLVLEGTVVAPDGSSPVDRVLVEALDVGADGEVTSLGRGRTDESGRYFIILPAH